MGRDGLLIGEVAARSGVSRKALRLYEARGILPRPHRTGSGYRVYPTDVLGLLAFVGQARRLGLTLAEIGHVVALRRAGAAPCNHVRALLERKAADLAGLLSAVQTTLRAWQRHPDRHAAICQNIEAKGGDTSWRSSQSRSVPRARPARRSPSRATTSVSARPKTPSSSKSRSGTSSST